MTRRLFSFLLFSVFLFNGCEDKEETKYVIQFEPASEHDFGKVEVNNSASKKIRIKNTEESSGSFTGTVEILESQNFQMDFSGVLVLQKNESKDIYLTFIPSAAEEYSGKLVVKNDDTFNEFYLSGIGGSPVSFSISPVALDFGLVESGGTKDMDLRFENNAESGFDLELALDLPLSDFTIGSQTNFVLAPGANKTITVRYTPTQNTATKTIQITHNSSIRANPATVQLTGVKDISSQLVSNVTEAWSLFLAKDYSESVKKFQETINGAFVNSVYDSISDEAVHGRGWARLFEQGTNDYAQAAFNDFLNAFSGGLMSSNSDYDALAGVSISGVLALVNNTNHYDNVVTAANTLLNDVQNYQFKYNNNVDHKDVRYALIQAYFNLSNYTDAAKQLDILVPANAPHTPSAESVLVAIQALAGKL